MILIAGLRNHGRKFFKTRHNLGFRIVNNFRKKNRFPGWKEKRGLKAKISKGEIEKKKILLVKPQTFMNDSGKAIKPIINHYKIPIEKIWVIHDDLDIPLGKIKIAKGRGSAGHRGVQSIINELGSKSFVRFRVGILPKAGKPKNIGEFVLQKFNKKEKKIIKKVVKKTVRVIDFAIKQRLEKAMGKFNK